MSAPEPTPKAREQYTRRTWLNDTDTLIVTKRGGGERRIEACKWYINRRTPVGEDAELWERMPYGGRREIQRVNIIAVERGKKTWGDGCECGKRKEAKP